LLTNSLESCTLIMAEDGKRVEINEDVDGVRVRVSRTGGANLSAAPAGGLTLNTKHGARVSRTTKGLTLGFQNFSSVIRGRWSAGGMNVNLSKSGLSASNKNALGTFNFRRPKSSSATVGGIQVRGEVGALISFIGMCVSLIVMLANFGIQLSIRVFLVLAWLGQLVWNSILVILSSLVFIAVDLPKQLLSRKSKPTG
jgi:hypothetical protein